MKTPPLVGLSEAAEILGVDKSNLRRMRDVPESLQTRFPGEYQVSSGPLWFREELEAVAKKRKAHVASD
jgi:hypothetical protein